MIRPRTAWLLFALLVVVLGSFLLWPLFKVIGGGCFVDGHFTPEYLLGVFRNPIYAEGLLNSLGSISAPVSSAIFSATTLVWPFFICVTLKSIVFCPSCEK